MKDFIKSVFAGLMIGIAALTSLGAGGSWPGALLFSIGLIIICSNEYNLYTGKIGYIKTIREIPKMLLYIIGNLIGVFIVSLSSSIQAIELVNVKLSLPIYLVLLKSIGCGFLMFIAVDGFKKNNNIISIVCAIPAFILSGFEHSIADMFYILVSHTYSLKALGFIIIVLFGNAIGALAHNLIREKR